jgi:hypothetical protein
MDKHTDVPGDVLWLEKQRIGGVYLGKRRCGREQLPDLATNKIFELDDVGTIQLAECSKKSLQLDILKQRAESRKQ